MYCVHTQKRASCRSHFRACKISKFPGGMPLHNPHCVAPLFVFVLSTPNPFGFFRYLWQAYLIIMAVNHLSALLQTFPLQKPCSHAGSLAYVLQAVKAGRGRGIYLCYYVTPVAVVDNFMKAVNECTHFLMNEVLFSSW